MTHRLAPEPTGHYVRIKREPRHTSEAIVADRIVWELQVYQLHAAKLAQALPGNGLSLQTLFRSRMIMRSEKNHAIPLSVSFL